MVVYMEQTETTEATQIRIEMLELDQITTEFPELGQFLTNYRIKETAKLVVELSKTGVGTVEELAAILTGENNLTARLLAGLLATTWMVVNESTAPDFTWVEYRVIAEKALELAADS